MSDDLRKALRDMLVDTSWIKPRHTRIFDPADYAELAEVTSGAWKMRYRATGGENDGPCIELEATATGTGSFYLALPTPAETGLASTRLKCAGRVLYRVWCSDWSRIQTDAAAGKGYIKLWSSGGQSSGYYAYLVHGGKSDFGCKDPNYGDAWNGKLRTLAVASKRHTKVGAPDPWQRESEYFVPTGIGFEFSANGDFATKGSVKVRIALVVSEEWPVGYAMLTGDGTYSTWVQRVVADLVPNGVPWVGSINRVNEGGIYPNVSTLAELCLEHRGEIIQHGHVLTLSGSPLPLIDTGDSSTLEKTPTTPLIFGPIWRAQRARMINAGVDPRGLRGMQFLQNLGCGSAFDDVAGFLRAGGVDMSRADVSDARFGINPAVSRASYTSRTSLLNDAGWAYTRGQYNVSYLAMYQGVAVGDLDSYAAAVGVVDSAPDGIAYADTARQGVNLYTHEIGPVTANNIGINFWRDMLFGDLFPRVKAGRLVLLNYSLLAALTINGPDYYRDWDNVWRRRLDNSVAW